MFIFLYLKKEKCVDIHYLLLQLGPISWAPKAHTQLFSELFSSGGPGTLANDMPSQASSSSLFKIIFLFILWNFHVDCILIVYIITSLQLSLMSPFSSSTQLHVLHLVVIICLQVKLALPICAWMQSYPLRCEELTNRHAPKGEWLNSISAKGETLFPWLLLEYPLTFYYADHHICSELRCATVMSSLEISISQLSTRLLVRTFFLPTLPRCSLSLGLG